MITIKLDSSDGSVVVVFHQCQKILKYKLSNSQTFNIQKWINQNMSV